MAQPRTHLIHRRIPRKKGYEDASRLSSMLPQTVFIVAFSLCIMLLLLVGKPFQHFNLEKTTGLFLLISITITLFITYAKGFQSDHLDTKARKRLFILILLVTLLVNRIILELGNNQPWLLFCLPIPLITMTLTIMYSHRFAFDTLILIFALLMLQILVLGQEKDLNQFHFSALGILLIGSLVPIFLTRNLRRRTVLLKIGILTSLAMNLGLSAFSLLGAWYFDRDGTLGLLPSLLLLLGHGTMTGILATSLIPLLEQFSGIVTEIRLLELGDGNHPLLRMMLERAPGTYMHTQNVARIASAAVEAIGGNALLTRVGTLFHDLGKMVRPEYFTENEPNSKLFHERLSPAMSGIIILSHVKEGVALARQYKLPRVLEDFITGHHGTSCVQYFYRMAKMQAREGERIEESHFRYPGPKPQTREAAVVAIADLVEAAGRAKLDGAQTPASLQKFVHECIMSKLNDGQFEECDLSLRDLKIVEESIVKTLASMYHHRVKYPDDPDAKKRKLALLEKEEHRKMLARRKEKILTQ